MSIVKLLEPPAEILAEDGLTVIFDELIVELPAKSPTRYLTFAKTFFLVHNSALSIFVISGPTGGGAGSGYVCHYTTGLFPGG